MSPEKNTHKENKIENDVNSGNSCDYQAMILCFENKRYLIPDYLLNDLIERKEPNIILCDVNKNPNISISFDWIPLVFRIKPLMKTHNEIVIPIKGIHHRKGDIIQVSQSGMIDNINDYFESHFFDGNEFYILKGDIDTGPNSSRISRQDSRINSEWIRNTRLNSKKIPNSKRVKGFLGKDESYYNEKSDGYDLSLLFETESESSWLHDGFCDEKSENEDDDNMN